MEPEEFETERAWLSHQPRMGDWDAGKTHLHRQLGEWVKEYTGKWRESALGAGDPQQGVYRRRLWQCWAFHWRQAADASDGRVDGWIIAAERRAGQGFGGARLTGDPFADVVLAQAVVEGDRRARAAFESRMRSFCRAQAQRANLDRGDADWWDDFMTHLSFTMSGGEKSRPFTARGALGRFRGQSVLEPWLQSVARHFFCDRHRARMSESKEIDAPGRAGKGVSASAGWTAEFGEQVEFVRARYRTALAALAPRDQLLVRSGKGRQMTNQRAAECLGHDAGHVSRLRPAANLRFLTELRTRFPEPEWQSFLEWMAEHPDDFADSIGEPTGEVK